MNSNLIFEYAHLRPNILCCQFKIWSVVSIKENKKANRSFRSTSTLMRTTQLQLERVKPPCVCIGLMTDGKICSHLNIMMDGINR